MLIGIRSNRRKSNGRKVKGRRVKRGHAQKSEGQKDEKQKCASLKARMLKRGKIANIKLIKSFLSCWNAVVLYGYGLCLATGESRVRIYLTPLRSDLGQVAHP